jgi:hypothetical protein
MRQTRDYGKVILGVLLFVSIDNGALPGTGYRHGPSLVPNRKASTMTCNIHTTALYEL